MHVCSFDKENAESRTCKRNIPKMNKKFRFGIPIPDLKNNVQIQDLDVKAQKFRFRIQMPMPNV